MSRRTFYEIFDSRQHCFLAVIDEGYRRSSLLIAQAFQQSECWQDGVRTALAELLQYFDAEPELARVWFVESLAAGSWALQRRAHHVAALTREIVEYWRPPPDAGSHPLATTAVMESVLAMIHGRALAGGPEPMITLLGPLTGVISAPYLDKEAVAVEVGRGSELARSLLANLLPRRPGIDQVPSALKDPRAHRARLCLSYLNANPGASNREIADVIDIASHSQISTLLTRLQSTGLLDKQAGRPGHPNAWSLTPQGQDAISAYTSHISDTSDAPSLTS